MTILPSPLRGKRTAVVTGAVGISLTVAACGAPHPAAQPLAGVRQATDAAAPLGAAAARPADRSASLTGKAEAAAGTGSRSGDGSGSRTADNGGTASGKVTGAGSTSTGTNTGAGSSASTTGTTGKASLTGAISGPPPLLRGSTLLAPSGPPSLTVAAQQTIPGSLGADWPNQGQAQIDINGDVLGTYGPVSTAQPIASVTKTMTAYLILHDHPLNPGDQGPTITITAADVTAYQYDVTQDMSVVPVQAGEQITENEALEALMLPSANNIADVLAHWDTGTTTDAAFVTKMNAEAVALGMKHTDYADASGFDPGSVSTAPDQITLGRNAMAIPYFANLVQQTSAVIPVAGTIDNVDTLLGTDGIDGIKTGSTSQAGGCLLFNANITVDGRALTITGAVLGQDAPSGEELGVGLAAAQALISSTESKIGTYTLVSAGSNIATIPLSSGGTLTLHPTENLTVTGWPSEPVTLSLVDTASGLNLQATSTDGENLGSVPLS